MRIAFLRLLAAEAQLIGRWRMNQRDAHEVRRACGCYGFDWLKSAL